MTNESCCDLGIKCFVITLSRLRPGSVQWAGQPHNMETQSGNFHTKQKPFGKFFSFCLSLRKRFKENLMFPIATCFCLKVGEFFLSVKPIRKHLGLTCFYQTGRSCHVFCYRRTLRNISLLLFPSEPLTFVWQ